MRNNDFPEFEERLPPKPAPDQTTTFLSEASPAKADQIDFSINPKVKKILFICCTLLLVFSIGGVAYSLIAGKEERALNRQIEKEERLNQKAFEIRSKASQAIANKDRGAYQAAMAELQELTSKNQDIIEGQKKRIQAGQEAARQDRVAAEKKQLEGMIAGWTKQPPSKNAFFRQRWILQNESRFSGFQPEVAALGREAMANFLAKSAVAPTPTDSIKQKVVVAPTPTPKETDQDRLMLLQLGQTLDQRMKK